METPVAMKTVKATKNGSYLVAAKTTAIIARVRFIAAAFNQNSFSLCITQAV